jgi:peptidoglycan glycosyltransferase
VLARSDPSDDQYSYQRVYPGGPTFANLTGYYSMRYGPTGVERNQNEILSGEAPELIAGQLSDLITGRDPRGGNVELNIEPAVQQAAYTAMTEKNYVGAVVAIEPSTGRVLAIVSTPSFDPNPLASHSDAVQRQAYNDLVNADPSPLLNRATAAVYPPGSTFKLVIASKTRTAENGTDPKNTPPHAWYVAFAPADNPKVAVAVMVENGGDLGLDATGGKVAGPVGRSVIAAALAGGP